MVSAICSDGSKVCVPHVGESSKLRTYEIHKNLTDILLKNKPCKWIRLGGSRDDPRLDKSIITDYTPHVKRFIVAVHPNLAGFP